MESGKQLRRKVVGVIDCTGERSC